MTHYLQNKIIFNEYVDFRRQKFHRGNYCYYLFELEILVNDVGGK